MPYSPGLSGYLTERGTLYYNGRSPENNHLSRFPFKGGVALEADWTGNVLWEVRHPDHHHDGILLRNGNVLLDCMSHVPDEIARRVKGGIEEPEMRSEQYLSRPKDDPGKMYSSYFVELTPEGKSVWSGAPGSISTRLQTALPKSRRLGRCGIRAMASRSCLTATSSPASGQPPL